MAPVTSLYTRVYREVTGVFCLQWQEAINVVGLVSQKEKFVTLLLIDMIKLTTVPIFQNLIRKQKKQKKCS